MKNILKYFFPALLIILSTSTNVFCGQPRDYNVGIYQNPPLVFVDDNGHPKGIAIEILEYIAKAEKWNLAYVDGTWAECFERLHSGEIDILPGIAFSEERNERLDFNKEVIVSNNAQVSGHQYPHGASGKS